MLFSEYITEINNGVAINELDIESKDSPLISFSRQFFGYFVLNPLRFDFLDENSSPRNDRELLETTTLLLPWNDQVSQLHPGVALAIFSVESSSQLNRILTIIFLVVNLIFIMMILHRKVKDLSKQVGVLKSLGYNSRAISSSFTSFGIVVVIFGGLLSIGVGYLMHQLFLDRTIGYLWFDHASVSIPPFMFLRTIILPLIFISLFVWAVIFLIIKKPTVKLLNNTTAHKPNIFVRSSSIITSRLSFVNAYSFKNTLRAMGKSTMTFGSILFSSLFLVFGITIISFPQRAADTTAEISNFDNWHTNRDEIVYLSTDEINKIIDYDNLIPYTFGVNHDYWNPDPIDNPVTSNPARYGHLEFDGVPGVSGYDYGNPEHVLEVWQYDITSYMRNTVIDRTTTAIISDYETSKSISNTALLFVQILAEERTDLLSRHLQYISPTQTVNYEHSSFSRFVRIFESINSEFNKYQGHPEFENEKIKILFDVFEEHKNTSIGNSVFGIDFEVDGRNVNEDSKRIILTGISSDDWNKGHVNMFRGRNDLNKKIADSANKGDGYAYVLIDSTIAKTMGIRTGDIINIEKNDPDAPNPPIEPLVLNLKVLDIYDTYFEISWYANFDDELIREFIYGVRSMYWNSEYHDWDDPEYGMWYNNESNLFDKSMSSTYIFDQVDNSIFARYSTFTSGSRQNTFTLLGEFEEDHSPFSAMGTFSRNTINKEAMQLIASQSIETLNNIMTLFIGFAFIIVIFILFVLGTEIIQSSRREVSTLKALGYTSRTNSYIVLVGNVFIMIVSVLLAIPLGISILSAISSIIALTTGFYINFTPTFSQVSIILFIILIFAIIVYMLGVLVYKYTSQLDSLQRE